MPTGFTSLFLDNPAMTFEQWALRCARGMGVLIHMRDEPFDAPIPEKIEPSAYYRDELEKAEARGRELEMVTLEDARRRAAAEYQESMRYAAECRSEHATEVARHEEMRLKAEAWVPPTGEHEGIKHFMLEQISTSAPHPYEPPIRNRTAEQWLAEERKYAADNIAIRRSDWKRSQENAEKATQWLADLRRSLPTGSADPK